MKPQILTIFPHPAERYLAVRTMDGSSSRGLEAPDSSASAPNVLPSIESLILRKLLAEVEARQITRVQPAYVIEQPPSARHDARVRALWGSLWAASILIATLTVKYVDSQTMVPKQSDGQSRSMEILNASIVHQNETFATIVSSLQQLAGTVASSAKRAEEMPELLSRLSNHLQQIRPAAIRQSSGLALQPEVREMSATTLHKDDSAPITIGRHVHPAIEWVITPSNVVAHHNSAGAMDYWLVPRMQSGVWTMAKVVPIAQNNSGTLVHHIADVKDYIVTSSGEWIESSEPVGTKE